MKKTCFSLIILMIFLLSGCATNNENEEVKDGTYIMEHEETEEVFLPYVEISDDKFKFSYDLLSSYLSIGTFSIDDGKLTMTTDDNKYTYVFKIDGDKLTFQKNESSSVALIDDGFGVKVTDNSKFYRKDD